MPGLVGVAGTCAADQADRSFTAAAERMLRHRDMQAVTISTADRRCLVADVRAHSRPSGIAGFSAAKVLLHGVLHNTRALRDELAGNGPHADNGELLACYYARHGFEFLARLRGEFALALIDERQGHLLLATDLIGSYPIYWHIGPHGLVFSSDLSALIKGMGTAVRLDMQAVADYVTIGAVLGDKTLAAEVKILDPGTALIYNLHTGAVSHHRYVDLESFFAGEHESRSAYLRSLQRTFTGAVERALGGEAQFGLSLSGGLDSRAILSAVNSRASTLRTYTLGVEGCADQVIADELSTIAGSRHTFFRMDSSYLKDFFPNMAQMVSHTDGMYLSHGLTEMLAIHFLSHIPIQVLLRGHGGELAKAHLAWPLHTDHRVYQMTSVSELVPYLSERANYITREIPLSRFLLPEAAQLTGEGVRTAFADALAGKRLSPANCCSYLYVREMHRRFTVPSLELFRTRVEVRLPFLDWDFLAVLLSAPPEWRDSTSIHQALTATGIPKLLRVRNSNSGAPADAGPRRELVFDKINTILKRLNVHGYRHYHHFDAWMRDTLLATVEAELTRPHARVESFVKRGALQELLRETRDGTADRGYLLQVILILELWMRENDVQTVA